MTAKAEPDFGFAVKTFYVVARTEWGVVFRLTLTLFLGAGLVTDKKQHLIIFLGPFPLRIEI